MAELTTILRQQSKLGPINVARAAMRDAADALDAKDKRIAELEAGGWQPIETAPKDGTHCLLAVKSDAFVWTVSGAFHNGQWNCAFQDNVEPLYWMPAVRLPDGWETRLPNKEDRNGD